MVVKTKAPCAEYKVRSGKDGRCVYIKCPPNYVRKGKSCVEKKCPGKLVRVGTRCRAPCKQGYIRNTKGDCQFVAPKQGYVINKITGRQVKRDGPIGLWMRGKGPNPYPLGGNKAYSQYSAKK